MTKKLTFITYFIVFIGLPLFAQEEFSLYQQFDGKYDFTFIGNTMNVGENNYQGANCTIQNTSSAELSLSENDQIEKAYLYWSGSGSGHLQIKLNDTDIVAEQFYNIYQPSNRTFFVAFTDVTQQVQNTGNGTYTVSDFDLSDIIYPLYCSNATNYAGWGLVIIYKNETLPLNQISLFNGFDHISGNGQGTVVGEVTITLDNLNVADNTGARIGFIAWEGDSSWQLLESLMLNGEKLSDPPLNPEYNIFNSTNSVTGSSELYNMDLDIYDAQDYIQIGDTSAEVKITSGQDFIMLSTIITKFNNNHPDATVSIDNATADCDSNQIEIHYTVYNNEATNFLPANTPIAVYIDGILTEVVYTQNNIEINEYESGSIIIDIPNNTEQEIEIIMVADDVGDGSGIIVELNESNNHSLPYFITISNSPLFNELEDLISCNTGERTAVFDFSEYEYLVKQDDSDNVSFYTSYEEALSGINAVSDITSFTVQNQFPKEIFVRIDNGNCYIITSFFLNIRNCPPVIYNGISANDDGLNDDFHIEGLYDIFENFELFIYSRWGTLIWKGNNDIPKWNGRVTEKHTVDTKNAPEGTYFYILYLNDEDYPSPLSGYLYLTR